MKCELCGTDPQTISILPFPNGKGSLDTMACVPCAIESGHYCEKHERPHLGSMCGKSACLACVQELVELNADRDATIAELVRDRLLREEWEQVEDYVRTAILVTEETQNRGLLRILAWKAQRFFLEVPQDRRIKAVIDVIERENSALFILT